MTLSTTLMKQLFCSNLFETRRKVLTGFFLIGLVYVLIPGPTMIEQFPPLPNSTKSQLEGDTIQNPNIAAYFADFRRDFIVNFYKQQFMEMHLWRGLLPPIRINRPPEEAYRYIRDQQESTFLEEYVYPLRESFFVNGYEPLVENMIYNRPSNYLGNHIIYREIKDSPERLYEAKATIRFYPTSIFTRIFIYLSIWILAVMLFKLSMKAIRE